MNENKIVKDFMSEVPPVDIPSIDTAWVNMQQKLDTNENRKRVIGWRRLYPVFIIMVLIGTGWWVLKTGYFTRGNVSIAKVETMPVSLKVVKDEKDELNKEKLQTRNEEKKPKSVSSKGRVKDLLGGLSQQSKVQRKQYSASASKQQNDRRRKIVPLKVRTIEQPKSFPIVENIANDSSSISLNNSPEFHRDSLSVTKTIDSKKEEQQSIIETQEEHNTDNKEIQVGLQLNAQLPTTNLHNYLDGPGGSAQPYRLFFPAIWVSLKSERSMFTVQLHPFESSVLSRKPYSGKTVVNGTDIVFESRTVQKVFGTSAYFSYDYNIKNKWWLGGNIQPVFWRTATATVKGERINASNGGTSVAYENNYTFNDSAWADFEKFQFGAGVQMFYKEPKWQVGVNFNFYLLPLTDNNGQKNQIKTQIFFRWPLYTKAKRE